MAKEAKAEVTPLFKGDERIDCLMFGARPVLRHAKKNNGGLGDPQLFPLPKHDFPSVVSRQYRELYKANEARESRRWLLIMKTIARLAWSRA